VPVATTSAVYSELVERDLYVRLRTQIIDLIGPYLVQYPPQGTPIGQVTIMQEETSVRIMRILYTSDRYVRC
jgi:hypothetical protein